MNDIKKTLTKIVVSELNARYSKKSSGTKIASSARIIPITVIKPFSI